MILNHFYFQERIRSYMNRVREAEEKINAPRIDKEATKRFVRSALWQQAHKDSKQGWLIWSHILIFTCCVYHLVIACVE